MERLGFERDPKDDFSIPRSRLTIRWSSMCSTGKQPKTSYFFAAGAVTSTVMGNE